MWALVVSVVAVAITSITYYWLYRRWNPSCNGTLPPGSMGSLFVGEYLQFRAKSTTFDIHPFVKERMERYGPVFRTSIFGTPLIVSTDPELNHYIFQQEGQTIQSWYPASFNTIFGKENIGSLHGFMYKHLKSMVLSLFGPESMKTMLPEVEGTVLTKLQQWSTREAVELKDATASVSFKV